MSGHGVMILTAIVAGVAFSSIAWSYRAASARSIPACFVALGMGIAGVLWFGFRASLTMVESGTPVPVMVWIWGVASGLAQGGCVWIYREGLRQGPMAPLWCAGNLIFVMPALFAVTLLGERLSGMQTLGLLMATVCVAAAAAGHEGAGPVPGTIRSRTRYAGMLVLLVALTGLCGMALKHMAAVPWQGRSMNPHFNDAFMFVMYATLLLCVAAEVLARGAVSLDKRRIAGYAVVAGMGSVLGMTLTGVVSNLPGGIGFALIAVSAMVAGSCISSFGFGERRGMAWWATVALAVASVLAFNTVAP